MAFKIGDIIIDHVAQIAFADSNDVVKYILSQISECTINITAEATDINDARGNRIMQLFRAKQGELTVTNAFISEPLIASKSGRDAELATSAKAITMPKIVTVKSGTTATLTGFDDSKHAISVIGTDANYNAASTVYTLGTTASATEYAIDSNKVFTPPTDPDVSQFVVRYDRDVTEGVKIVNSANDMPASGQLYIKAFAIDPCNNSVLTACYIHCPNFTPNPDMELNLSGGDTQQMSYNGTLNANYCSETKEIFVYYRASATTDSEDRNQ